MAQYNYPTIDVEDYLILDKNSRNARYEYLDGELRMLAGGSLYHSAIIANLTIAIGRFLRDSSYWIYNSDVQLRLSETRYVHPDVTVSCDERDHEAEDAIQYPCLVIEVLSPSTEAIDKIKKLAYYQECPAIQDYIMVDSPFALFDEGITPGKRSIALAERPPPCSSQIQFTIAVPT